MAAEFDTARVVVQPTQQEQPIPTDIFGQGASVFGQEASTRSQEAEAQTRRGEGLFARASASFDRALEVYNKYAEQKAAEDAPQSIKRDGNGNIIPPSSFYPPGISTRAYAESYKATSMALYKSFAEQELVNHSAVLKEQYPSDPTAYAVGMNQKRAAMQTNLDPAVAPWISVRGEQIQAQGITQITVANQSAKNAVTKQQYDLDRQGLTDRVGGMVANTSQAQGGGGSEGGYANNVGNITSSGDPYHGGKGLPYLTQGGRKFETFQSAEHGVAATYSLVKNKLDAAGGMTFEELISGKGAVKGWDSGAPALNKANYAAKMAEAAGLKPGDAVPIGDDAKMTQVIKAMNFFEKGKNTVSDASIENGIKLAKGNKDIPLSQQSVDAVRVPDAKQLTEAANNAVNLGTVQQDIEKLRTLGKSAGLTDDQINFQIGEIRFNAQMKGISEQIKNSSQALYDLQGNPQPGAVADLQERIRSIASQPEYRNAGKENLVLDILTRAMGEAQQQAQRRAQQIQVNDQKAAEPRLRQMMADQAEAKLAGLRSDSVTANAISQKLERQTQSYLTDTSISDSVAMKLATAGFSAGAVSRGALQEANNNRLVGLSNTIHDPAASPDQKAAAHESALAIRKDPEVYSQLTAGQRSALQGTMDDYVRVNYGAQVQAYNNEILKGNTSPAEVAKVREYQVKHNMIPPEQIAETGRIDAAAATLYQAKQTQSAQAAQLVDDFTKGKSSTPEVKAAHEKEVNKRPPKGAPAWNLSNPEHVADLQQFYQQYGYLPAQAKASLDAIQHSPDAEVMKGPLALYETISQVERQQAEKTLGTDYDKNKEGLIAANIAAAVGDNATYLATAKFYDPLQANKKELAFGDKGKAGSTGQTVDQANQSVGAAVDNLAGILAQKNLNVFAQDMDNPAAVVTDEADMTTEQKALRAAGQLVPSGGGGGFFSNLLGMSAGKFDNVVFTPEVREELTRNGVMHLANDGNAIRTITPGAGQPEQFVANTAFFTGVRDNRYEATRSADGKTMIIGYKSLGGHMGPALGIQVPAGSPVEQGLGAGILSAENFRLGRGLTDINKDYVSSMPYQAANGQMRFLIAYKDRNGNVTQQMDIAKDDPRIAIQALASVKAAGQAILEMSGDPQTYGKILLAGAVGSGPGAIALLKDGDIIGNWVRYSTIIGNTVQQMQLALNRPGMMQAMLGEKTMLTSGQFEARKNMQVEAIKLLTEVDAELKKHPDAPGLKQALSHMIEQHAPGTDSTAIQNLIKDSGFYQPGREPIDRGKTRINKEDTR